MRSVGASPERRSRARRPRAGVRCGAAAAGQRECSGLPTGQTPAGTSSAAGPGSGGGPGILDVV
jgi:hypothetical protein